MKPSASFHTLIEVAMRRRDEALQALGQAQREHQQAQLQMVQLQGYSAESIQRWSQRAAQGVSPTLLHTHQAFMGKLEHAVTFQSGVLQRMQGHIDHCRQQWQQAERELASLQKYQQRRHQTWQQQMQRQDQKSNDEMAANVHRYHSNHSDWRPPV